MAGGGAYFDRYKGDAADYVSVMELDNGIWDTNGIRFSGSDEAAEILARVGKNSLAPINASAIGNCFSDNLQNWEVWCGEPQCMNDPKWLSKSSGNTNGTCGQ